MKKFLIVGLVLFGCKTTKPLKHTTQTNIRSYKGYYFQYYDPGTYKSVPYQNDTILINNYKQLKSKQK